MIYVIDFDPDNQHIGITDEFGEPLPNKQDVIDLLIDLRDVIDVIIDPSSDFEPEVACLH